MKSHVRGLIAASTTAAALLVLAVPANAGGYHPPPPSTNCGSYDSISDWKAVQGDWCTQGDKKFTLIETNLDSGTDIKFEMSQDGLTHTFKVTEDLKSSWSDKTYYIKYSIEVLDPNYLITGVLLDSAMDEDQVSADTTVTKKIYKDGVLVDTLTSTEGSDDSSVPLSADYLIIKDYVFIPKKQTEEVCNWVWKHGRLKKVCNEYEYKDQLDWFANVFVQSPKPPTEVPEPEALALFGAGLVALGLLSRRRRQI